MLWYICRRLKKKCPYYRSIYHTSYMLIFPLSANSLTPMSSIVSGFSVVCQPRAITSRIFSDYCGVSTPRRDILLSVLPSVYTKSK
jgi:hypothetical protein